MWSCGPSDGYFRSRCHRLAGLERSVVRIFLVVTCTPETTQRSRYIGQLLHCRAPRSAAARSGAIGERPLRYFQAFVR